MTNLDQFIIHSAYPVEKIVWTAEGVVDSSNPYWYDIFGGYVFVPITNEVDARDILIDGVWSNDDWATQYPINTNSLVMGFEGSAGQGYSPAFDEMYADVFADGIYFEGWDFTVPYQSVGISGSTHDNRKIQYKVWAYLTETTTDANITAKTAETMSHALQKNTNLAQLNMISENILTVPSGNTVTLHHNLGFRPFCKMWRRTGGYLDGGAWQKNDLWTVYNPTNPYLLNRIDINDHDISIYAVDPYDGDNQDFLIRIFNYAIPSQTNF